MMHAHTIGASGSTTSKSATHTSGTRVSHSMRGDEVSREAAAAADEAGDDLDAAVDAEAVVLVGSGADTRRGRIPCRASAAPQSHTTTMPAAVSERRRDSPFAPAVEETRQE